MNFWRACARAACPTTCRGWHSPGIVAPRHMVIVFADSLRLDRSQVGSASLLKLEWDSIRFLTSCRAHWARLTLRVGLPLLAAAALLPHIGQPCRWLGLILALSLEVEHLCSKVVSHVCLVVHVQQEGTTRSVESRLG